MTLADGFTPPKDVPATLDVMPISVKTDPGLALETRTGTGCYKVPSLKGSGTVATTCTTARSRHSKKCLIPIA